MVTFELKEGAELNENDRRIIEKAKKFPIIYDDDCPELTEDMENAFIAARKKKPYKKEPLTIYVSASTLEKAKKMGTNYITILGMLLDKAVDDYKIVKIGRAHV